MQLGWLGAGVMGARRGGHLIEAGHTVTVRRNRARAASVLERGGIWAADPAEAAWAADVVFTGVGYPADVKEVVLGARGVLAGARSGSTLLDMTTSEPSLAEEVHLAASARRVGAIEAPVAGGDVGARQGTLSIMVGGDESVLEGVRPLLDLLGSTIVHHGGPGAGTTRRCSTRFSSRQPSSVSARGFSTGFARVSTSNAS
jgi:3-hydroxyisobutyrate dehydrogenase